MDLATWMRSFTIRTRMHGAIALVLLVLLLAYSMLIVLLRQRLIEKD